QRNPTRKHGREAEEAAGLTMTPKSSAATARQGGASPVPPVLSGRDQVRGDPIAPFMSPIKAASIRDNITIMRFYQ
ncbi:MAG TPA: hypothetical protein VFQ82_00260, partial [Stellaceae bacterium]|nr:hypothetical protein [Stellaceae bacterium]